MRCLITAGPTWEPIDRVRRLTNFSTGSLGGELANHLAASGHSVTLFLGEGATWRSSIGAVTVEPFSNTQSLAEALHAHATTDPVAVFHAAAVSDFTGGSVGTRDDAGVFTPLSGGKLSTRGGSLWVELVPTPKILPNLRTWFPNAQIVGWKYEVDGDTTAALNAVARQFRESRNNLCVVNGAAYGPGFGLVEPTGSVTHLPDRPALYRALADKVSS